jgi:hypothetical protein
MSKRRIYLFGIAGIGAVLLALWIDLVSSALAIGAKLAIDDMTSLVAFLFRAIAHAFIELAPTIGGCLAAAGVILWLVRWINRHDDPKTARHPSVPR